MVLFSIAVESDILVLAFGNCPWLGHLAFVKDKIHGEMTKLSGHKVGAFGIVVTSIFGVLSPLYVYGTIPFVVYLEKAIDIPAFSVTVVT